MCRKLIMILNLAVFTLASDVNSITSTPEVLRDVNEEELPTTSSNGLTERVPNVFSNIFRPFLPQTRFAGKTYGPNIIAIIGDKPYISMEIFNKFSPFKWLISAFQGKIQNVCNILAPQDIPDTPPYDPQDIMNQFAESNQKPTLEKQALHWKYGPVRVYDGAANKKPVAYQLTG